MPARARPILLIPAFDEEARLPAVLARVREAAPDFEVVVVDDGSRDATGRVASQHGASVLRHPFNLGYGAALQTGYKYALQKGATLVVQMDGDGQHDPLAIPALVAPLLAGEADLVVGSRFLEPTAYRFGILRRTARGMFGAIAKAFGLRITDPTSGFQALGAGVLELYSREFFPSDFPDVDVLVAAHRSGFRVRECSVEMAPSVRASTLHGGLRPIYYVYKMLLSLWATSRRT